MTVAVVAQSLRSGFLMLRSNMIGPFMARSPSGSADERPVLRDSVYPVVLSWYTATPRKQKNSV